MFTLLKQNIPLGRLFKDPRPSFALLLAAFLFVGIYFLGFNRSLEQIVFMVAISCFTELLFGYWFKGITWKRFPISAVITGLGLAILTHYGHILWLGAFPVILAITSKYLITFQNRHIFNPGLFGIVMCLLLSDGLISTSPVYQWGASFFAAFYIVTLALLLFVYKIKRTVLVVSFLGLYAGQLAIRGLYFQFDLPFEMLLAGVFFSPAFYLFSFFMLTDPKTSPSTGRGQFVMALAIVLIDLVLHYYDITRSLFYAGFIYFAVYWFYLHVTSTSFRDYVVNILLKKYQALATVVLLTLPILGYQNAVAGIWQSAAQIKSPLKLTLVEHSISSAPSDLLATVDPRARHVAKWFYSFGDVVLTSDVNNDGNVDVFVSQPLKSVTDRAQLYLNQGSFGFKKFEIKGLENLRGKPEIYGSPVGGVFWDYDNDGDKDLLIVTLWGHPWLLKNTLNETGVFDLVYQEIFSEKMNSGAANVADLTGNGFLDVVISNIMPRNLKGYEESQPFNLFKLPAAVDAEDKRPVNIMRRNPFNAANGGQNYIYKNLGEGLFEPAAWLPDETRWTFDAGIGDLNQDGWPDIYFANTAGPDRLYLNYKGQDLRSVIGTSQHEVGQDTYRGMNVSFIDVEKNGLLDIYVSNMHKAELPEGSLLWRNNGSLNQQLSHAFQDKAFSAGLFNQNRFGWGASVGDIDMDGDDDLLQANGWLDDNYDHDDETCSSYIYRLFQIEQTPEDIHGYADNWPDLRGRCLYAEDSKRLFLNHQGKFHDVSSSVGWDKELETSRGIALTDLDNDGDLDVLVSHMTAPLSIYRNDMPRSDKWFGLKLVGNGKTCNTDAIGTVVKYNGITKYVYARNGLAAQNDIRLLFPTQKKVSKIEINWCGRFKEIETVEVMNNVYHTLKQMN